MKKMINKFMVAALSLATLLITGSAWAATPTPLVEWTAAELKEAFANGQTTVTKNGYTLNLNGNAVDANGLPTISSSAGILLDWNASSVLQNCTLLVRYSNWAKSSSTYSYGCAFKISNSKCDDAGFVLNNTSLKCFYDTHVFYSFNGTAMTSNSPTLPSSGYVATIYGDATGTGAIVSSNGLSYSGGYYTSCKWGSNGAVGASIGGPRGTVANSIGAPASVTIEAIALFGSMINTPALATDLSNFWFQDEITTWEGGAEGNWSDATKWSNGVPAAKMVAVIPAGAVVNVDGTIASGVTVQGAGTIVYDNITVTGTKWKDFPAAPAGLNQSTWTGTIVFKNYQDSTTGCRDFDSFMNTDSTVELENVKGFFNSNKNSPGTVCLTKGTSGNAALDICNGSSGFTDAKKNVYAKLVGDGKLFASWANGFPLLVKDATGFTGSIQTSNASGIGVVIGSDAAYNSPNAGLGKIVVNENAVASVGAGETWTAVNGIFINGTLCGAGTLASATTFGEGAVVKPAGDGLKFGSTITGSVTIDCADIVVQGRDKSVLITMTGSNKTLPTWTVTNNGDYTAVAVDGTVYLVSKALRDFYAKWAYAHAVYTWRGTGDFNSANGKFSAFDLTTGFDQQSGTGAGTFVGNTSYNVGTVPGFTQKHAFSCVFCHTSNGSFNGYTAPGSVLRLEPSDTALKTMTFGLTPMILGGMIVEEGATGYSFGGSNTTELGDPSNTNIACFDINESFAFGRNGVTYFVGKNEFDIAADRVFDFSTISAANQPRMVATTATSTGTPATTAGGELIMKGEGTLKVVSLTATGGAKLDYSNLAVDRETPFIDGNLVIDATTKLALPAGLGKNAPFKLCSGEITGAADGFREITVGDATFEAQLVFDSANGTVKYDTVKNGTISVNGDWSNIVWDSEGTPSAISPIELTFENDAVLTLAADVTYPSLKVKGTCNATIVLGEYACPAIDASSLTGTITITTANEIDVNAGSNDFVYNYTGDGEISPTLTYTGNFTKGGSGTMSLSHNVPADTTLTVASGTLKLDAGNKGISGVLNINAGTTFVNCGDSDRLDYNGSPIVNIYGKLDMGSLRWTVGANNVINMYPGSEVVGVGDANKAWDFKGNNSQNIIHFKTNDDEGGTIVFDTTIRLRSGDVTFDVEEGVTVNFKNTGAFAGSYKIVKAGAGAIKFLSGSLLDHAFSVDAGMLDFSGLADSAATIVTGNMTVGDGVSIRFPAGYEEDQTFTLCGGTLVAPETVYGVHVYVGEATTPEADAILHYDTANKTVRFELPDVVNVEFPEDAEISLQDIIDAVNAKSSGWTGDVNVTLDDDAVLTVDNTELPYAIISIYSEGDIAIAYTATAANKLAEKFNLAGVEGSITLTTAVRADVNAGGKDLTYNYTANGSIAPTVTNVRNFTKDGAGTITGLDFGTSYAGQVTINNGTISVDSVTKFGSVPKIAVNYSSVLELTNSADQSDSKSWNCTSITGTGTIRFRSTANKYRMFPTADNIWASTLGFEAQVQNGVIHTQPSVELTLGSLSGSGSLRNDYDSGTRSIKVIQSRNTEWSGIVHNSGNDRFSTLTVAGEQDAADKTLTLSGTQVNGTHTLAVESTGSVNLSGTWKGNVTVAGEIGGSGNVTGASAITFADGATICKDWGALTLNVAPTFGPTINIKSDSAVNVGDTILTGFTVAPTSIPAVTVNGQSTAYVLKFSDNALKIAQAAASVNGRGYDTFAAALAAAEALGTATITTHVYPGSSVPVTINVNSGKTITLVSDAAEPYIFDAEFTKTGEGTLILKSGGASMEPTITVSEGTLVFADGAYMMSPGFILGIVDVKAGATFELDYNDTATEIQTYALGFTGDGIVRKSGAADFVINGDVMANFAGTFEVAEGRVRLVTNTLMPYTALTINNCLKITGDADMTIDTGITLNVGANAMIDISDLNLERQYVMINGAVSLTSTTTYKFAANTAATNFGLCYGSVLLDGNELSVGTSGIITPVFVGEVENLVSLRLTRQTHDEGGDIFAVAYSNPKPLIRIEESMTSTQLNEAIDELGITGNATVYINDGAEIEMIENNPLTNPLDMYCFGNVNLTGTGTINANAVYFMGLNMTIDIGANVIFVPATPANLADATITGEGTIVYDGALPGDEKTNYQDDENWTGTVWLKNKTGVNDFHFENYGNANSKIKLTGISGYAPKASNPAQVDCPSEVILEDEGNNLALTLADGYSTMDDKTTICTYTFAKITGPGTIKDIKNKPTPQYRFVNVSGFTGTLYTQKMRFAIGNGTGIADSGKITIDAAATATIVADKTWTATSGIVVNGTIGGSGMLDGAVTFGDDATIDASAGTLQIAANKTVTFGATLNVTGAQIGGTVLTGLSAAPTAMPTSITLGGYPGEVLLSYANGTLTLQSVVATVNGKNYASVADAIAAANAVSGGATVNLLADNPSVTTAVALSQPVTFDIPENKTLTITGVISGSGKVIKTGAGTLLLGNQTNTFTGGLEVQNGLVKASVQWKSGENGPFGNKNNPITIGVNGTIDFNEAIVVGGWPVTSAGAIMKSGTNGDKSWQFVRTLTLTGNTTITGNGAIGVGLPSGATTLDLAGYILTANAAKADGSTGFFLNGTTVASSGTIAVTGGRADFYGFTVQEGASLVITKENAANLVFGGTITVNGTLTVPEKLAALPITTLDGKVVGYTGDGPYVYAAVEGKAVNPETGDVYTTVEDEINALDNVPAFQKDTNVDLTRVTKTGVSLTVTSGKKLVWTDSATSYIQANNNGGFDIVQGQPANGRDSFENYVLGLSNDNATAKPFLRAIQDQVAEDVVTFEFGGLTIPTAAQASGKGGLVEMAVEFADSMDDFADDTKVRKVVKASENAATISVDLPTAGNNKVRYYRPFLKVSKIAGDINTAIIPVPMLNSDPYDWYARHARICTEGPEHNPDIVLIGDSITHHWTGGWGANDDKIGSWDANNNMHFTAIFEGHTVLDCGYGYDRIENMIWRMQNGEIDNVQPKLIVIMAGTNNMTDGNGGGRTNTAAEMIEGLKMLIGVVKAKQSAANIVVMGILPRGAANNEMRTKAKTVNDAMLEYATEGGYTFLDISAEYVNNGDVIGGAQKSGLFSDGTHPTAAGYDIWGEALQSHLPTTANQ